MIVPADVLTDNGARSSLVSMIPHYLYLGDASIQMGLRDIEKSLGVFAELLLGVIIVSSAKVKDCRERDTIFWTRNVHQH